jgi:hypothetical protein
MLISLLALFSGTFAAAVHVPGPVPRQTNDGVHLVITPACGKLGGTTANVNAGIVAKRIKTLVAFGVCLNIVILYNADRSRVYVGLVHLGWTQRWWPSSGCNP